MGLVHADLPSDDWQDIRNGALTAREADYCIWSVDRYQLKYTGHVRNVRAVVHGHMTLACMETLGNAYFIDTNGGGGAHGHFTNSIRSRHGAGRVENWSRCPNAIVS